MIPVEQRIVHREDGNGNVLDAGDCFKASVASVLGLPWEDVPHFVGDYHDQEPGVWVEKFNEWARERGWWVLSYALDDETMEDGYWVHPGYWIASVISPRNKPTDADPEGTHAVVMRGGELAWDPHPGPFKGEHRGFKAAYIFAPLDPSTTYSVERSEIRTAA